MGVVESKVQASSLWALGASIAIAVLNSLQDNSQLLGHLPPVAQFMILAAVPPTLTFLSGYIAPHTPRPDLYAYAAPLEPWLPEPPPPPPVASPRDEEWADYAPAERYGPPRRLRYEPEPDWYFDDSYPRQAPPPPSPPPAAPTTPQQPLAQPRRAPRARHQAPPPPA